jgi:hypothetical protein
LASLGFDTRKEFKVEEIIAFLRIFFKEQNHFKEQNIHCFFGQYNGAGLELGN